MRRTLRPDARAALVWLGIQLIACAGCALPQAAPPPTAAPVASAGLETHTGLGYSISYPAGATVERIEPPERMPPSARHTWDGVLEWTRIAGPEVEMIRADVGQPHTSRAYTLDIVAYANPDGLDAETWARWRILDDWRRATEERLPLGGAPVEDGAIREDRVERAVVAGYPALRAAFWGGGWDIVRYYLVSGGHIVVLRYDAIPVENDPLGEVQEHAAWLLMSTLRLE